MNDEEVTVVADDAPSAGSRRGALAALLAGTALGLSSFGGGVSPNASAKRKKGRKPGRHKKGNGGNGKGKGKGSGGKGGVGGSLPSVRFVEKTTTFTSSGVVNASSKCPNGYLPISGGFFDSVSAPVLLTSMPRLDENDWYIELNGASVDEDITVIAVCLAASDDTQDEDTESESKNRKNRKRSRKN